MLAAATGGYCSAQELPPEALALVKEFEKETAAAKQRYGEEIARWRQRVVDGLTAVKKRLANEDRLEEAILVRDVAKVFSTGKSLVARPAGTPPAVRIAAPDVDFAQPLTQEQFAALPKEAQGVLLENEYPGNESAFVENSLAKKIAQLREDLLEIKQELTKEGKLDEAVAVRNWVAANLKSGPPSQPLAEEIEKPILPDITAAATGLRSVQVNYQQALQTAANYLARAQARPVEALIAKLEPLQGSFAKAGRLEDALAMRELMRKINADQSTSRRAATVSAAVDQLPAEAKREVEKFIKETQPLIKEWEQMVEKLNAQLLKSLTDYTAKALLDGDLAGARESLTALLMHRKEYVRLPEIDDREPLPLSEEVQETLEAFGETAHKLTQAADVAEAPRREALLAKLREAQARNLKFDEEMALDATIRYLEFPAHAGLRGTLLFQLNPVLKDDLAALVAAYIKESRAAFRALEQQHQEAFQQIEPRLHEIRKKQVESEDWKGAFATLIAQQKPQGVFEPIPVTLFRFPHRSGTEAVVVAVQDGLVRVRNHHGENWALREETRVADEPVTDFVLADAPSPGVPVNQRTPLKAGQLLLYKRGGFSWDIVQVVEAGLDKVKVRYTDRHNWEESLARADLRMVPEE
jgi:hypothetical protein